MAKLFGAKKRRRGARTKKKHPNNIRMERQAQTAKARFLQPKTLVQFFRDSPFVVLELDLERQNN